MTPSFIKSFPAGADVDGQRIVKFSGTDNEVVAGAANTDALIGVSDTLGADAGDMLDVIQGGWGNVQAGGNLSAGDPITADANGKAVAAAPVASTVVRYVGFVMVDAVDGDIVPFLFAPGIINTP